MRERHFSVLEAIIKAMYDRVISAFSITDQALIRREENDEQVHNQGEK